MSRKAYEMVPIWEKSNLSVDEAAAYTGIGTAKLREISDSESCDFVLWIGTKRLLKRKKLKEYLDNVLGHADVSTTMNIYVDVTNELKKNELKSFSAYMEGA